MPDGLKYIDGWIEANFGRCFQLMETDEPRLLQQWALRARPVARRRGRASLLILSAQ
jgi:Protein of unknown function (DUF3303)